jgi:hypothetical protein
MSHADARRRLVMLASAYVKKHPGEAIKLLGEKHGFFGPSEAQVSAAEDMVATDADTLARHAEFCDARIEELEAELAGDGEDGEEPDADLGSLSARERLALSADLDEGDFDDMDDAAVERLAKRHRVDPSQVKRPKKVDTEEAKPAPCPACEAAKMEEPK